MTKKMLIDASITEETRLVILQGQRLEAFETETKRQIKGNIYLARITRVEPSLQAAFVEYGGNRQGFLAFSEIHPDYFQIPTADRKPAEADIAAAPPPDIAAEPAAAEAVMSEAAADLLVEEAPYYDPLDTDPAVMPDPIAPPAETARGETAELPAHKKYKHPRGRQARADSPRSDRQGGARQ